MCSRSLLSLGLACVLTLTSVSCGLHTGEESPQAPPPSYSGNGFSCVGQIPKHLEDYVFDRLAGEEVTDFVKCLQKAFTAFAQFTRGRDEKTYAPEEIRRFLQTYFIKDKMISDELLHELMVIKRTFIGGTVDRISREELYVAIEVLEDIRKEALRLKPHLKSLNPQLARQQEAHLVGQNLREASAAVNESIEVISRRFQANRQDYPLANFEAFIREFRKFTGWNEHFPNAIPPAAWAEFLRVFKELTVSPEASDVIRARDWMPMLQMLARSYMAYLEYEVGVRTQPKLSGVGLQNTLHLAAEVFALVESAISRQENLTISPEQLTAAIKALKGIRWMPERWRLESMQSALATIVSRIFGEPTIPPDRRTPSGLSLRTLSRMKDAFYQWAYIQMNLDSQMGGTITTSNAIAVPNLQPEARRPLSNEDRPILNNPDWIEFLKVRGLMRPLYLDDTPNILVAPASQLPALKVEHGFYNLSLMNLLRSVVGLIFKGYSSDRSVQTWESGLTTLEMERFYDDFREIGIDLGFVDPRNVKTGSRVFIEGNLFTYSADGLNPEATDSSGKMKYVEAMELLAFLYSGGNLALNLYERFSKLCRRGPDLDINGRKKLDRFCVKTLMPKILPEYIGLLPEAKKFFASLTPEGRREYSKNLLETAYSPANSDPRWVELSEFSTLSVISYYAEAVMTRFDTDESGTLTNPEVDEANRLFIGFIKWLAANKMDQDLSDGEATAVFYFILANKRIPEGFGDGISIWWNSWFGSGSVELNRFDLSIVFSVIISRLSEGQDPSQNPHAVVLTPMPPAEPFSAPEWFVPVAPGTPCRGLHDALTRPECQGLQQLDPQDRFRIR